MNKTLQQIANDRETLHKYHESSRPLSKNYEYVGLKGESQFAKEFGFKIDKTLRPSGDNGKDFETKIGIIDVKTARNAYNLIVEEGKVVSDIYVLAKYIDDTDTVELLGWEYKKEILKAPTRDFGYGIINHYIPKNKLRSLKSLETIINENNGVKTMKEIEEPCPKCGNNLIEAEIKNGTDNSLPAVMCEEECGFVDNLIEEGQYLYTLLGWDVDVDENGPFIVNKETTWQKS